MCHDGVVTIHSARCHNGDVDTHPAVCCTGNVDTHSAVSTGMLTYESYDISSLGEPIVVIHVIRLDYISVLPAAQYFVHAPFALATASRVVAQKIFRWSPSRGAYCS